VLAVRCPQPPEAGWLARPAARLAQTAARVTRTALLAAVPSPVSRRVRLARAVADETIAR